MIDSESSSGNPAVRSQYVRKMASVVAPVVLKHRVMRLRSNTIGALPVYRERDYLPSVMHATMKSLDDNEIPEDIEPLETTRSELLSTNDHDNDLDLDSDLHQPAPESEKQHTRMHAMNMQQEKVNHHAASHSISQNSDDSSVSAGVYPLPSPSWMTFPSDAHSHVTDHYDDDLQVPPSPFRPPSEYSDPTSPAPGSVDHRTSAFTFTSWTRQAAISDYDDSVEDESSSAASNSLGRSRQSKPFGTSGSNTAAVDSGNGSLERQPPLTRKPKSAGYAVSQPVFVFDVQHIQKTHGKGMKTTSNGLDYSTNKPQENRKRPKPAEFFVLHFDQFADANASEDKELISASKGVSLGQAMAKPLERRGLASDQLDVFLECSATPLPLSSDCYLLAENILHVRQRSDGKKGLRHSSLISLTSLGTSAGTMQPPKGKKAAKGKKKPVSSSEDGGSYTDVSPYASLSRLGVPGPLPSSSSSSSLGVNSAGVSSSGLAPPAISVGSGFDSMRYRSSKGHSKLPALFSSPFAKTQDKHELLNEILAGYSRNGLPRMPELLTLGRPHLDLTAFHLERHWTDIVTGHDRLSKRQRDQQEAVWELLSTEIEYIRKLRVIIDLFLACLYNLQNEQLLNEIEVNKVFSNIADVFYSTCHFWVSHMCQMLRQARKTREQLDPSLLKAGFLVFEKIFDPYTKYCLEQDMCREYIKTKMAESELFRTFVTWAEMQKQCNRLRLVDLIVKPWQRLTKYKLLLHAMRKPLEKMALEAAALTPQHGHVTHGPSSTEEQKTDIEAMIDNVEKFLHHVNVSMRQRHNDQQLSIVADRIESYDAVDAPSEECVKLVNDFCKLDLTCPVPGCGQQETRILLLEGGLKLKDKDSKTDVYCFLFTDMLLITKATAKRTGDKVKVIKPPMRLDKIVVCPLRDIASFMLLYLNEYHIAQAVYTMHGDSKVWLDGIKKAQLDYRQKRCEYLSRADSILFDNSGDADDDIDYGPTVPGGEERVDSGSNLLHRGDSPQTSPDAFLPNNSDASVSVDVKPHVGVKLVRRTSSFIDDKKGALLTAARKTSPARSTTPTPSKHKVVTDTVAAALTAASVQSRGVGSPTMRHPRPRSAILMSRDEFLFSGAGGSMGGTESATKSRDDAEVQSPSTADIDDYLKVPHHPSAPSVSSSSVWYRTEVATNVVASSRPITVDLGRSDLVTDTSAVNVATTTIATSGSSNRNVRISKRPPLPSTVNRISGGDCNNSSSSSGASMSTDDGQPGNGSFEVLPPSDVSQHFAGRHQGGQHSFDEAESETPMAVQTTEVSGVSVPGDNDDDDCMTTHRQDTGRRMAGSTSPPSTSSSSSSLLLDTDRTSVDSVPTVRQSRDESFSSDGRTSLTLTPTDSIPRFSLWPNNDGQSSADTAPPSHRHRLTSAERRQLSKELVLTNPALEVSEV